MSLAATWAPAGAASAATTTAGGGRPAEGCSEDMGSAGDSQGWGPVLPGARDSCVGKVAAESVEARGALGLLYPGLPPRQAPFTVASRTSATCLHWAHLQFP